jgi:peroxiredoxin
MEKTMTRCAFFGALVLALSLNAAAPAGEFNKKLNIGDAVPAFSELPAVDGKNYSLADFADKDVLVMCVTCNHCPVAVAYEDRIIELTKKYAAEKDSNVAVVAVNVSNMEADELPKMQERAEEKGFNFHYLYDESQELGRSLGASVTPEFFVFNKDRKVIYMGALDDDMAEPTTDFVSAAVDSALNGTTLETAETRARGCGVRYEKKEQ